MSDKNQQVQKGQVLYLRDADYRGNYTGIITQVVVSAVWKKYFYIDGYRGYRKSTPIEIDTLTHRDKEYSQRDFKLYRSEQEIRDEDEKRKLLRLLVARFDKGRDIELESLRKISEILKLNTHV